MVDRNRRQSRAARSGFTLVELLVAISILAIVAVLGWRGLDGIVRARLTLNAQLDQTRGMQLAFAQLQRDCAQMAAVTAIPNRAPLYADQDRLLLIRHLLIEDQPSRLQVVAYRLQNGVLMRQESPATRDLGELDSLWQSALENTLTTPSIGLHGNISTMITRVWLAGSPAWRATTGPGAVPLGPPTLAGQGQQQGQIGGAPLPPGAPAYANLPTGLEVTLQPANESTVLMKIFLLGVV